MTRRVESVALVGRDASLWIAAAAVQRSLGHLGVSVRAIELPSFLHSGDVYSAIPAIQGLHKQIGLEEQIVVRAGKAVALVAQRYSNWAGAGAPFMLAYDSPPAAGSDVGFVHYWLKGRQEGLKINFEDFSAGVSAAKNGRVPVQREGAQLSAAHGYNLDAQSYCRLVKHHAERLGVGTGTALIDDVEIDGERISAVVLAGGERVEADLFIDASGIESALIGRLPGGQFEPWSNWLPCNRMVVAAGPPINPAPAYTQLSAFRAGWVGLYPLQDRTAVIAVYSSRHISDSDVVESLPLLARIPISGDAVVSEIRTGARSRAWIGNCVAVGEAAIALDALDSVGLHMTHGCVSHLMALFPAEADAFPEADLYDRTIKTTGQNLRDFQIAHYRLNRRFDEPFWDRCRDMDPPPSLGRKIELFSVCGQIPQYDDETFEEQNWAALLIGAGIIPERDDPRTDTIPDDAQIAKVQQRLRDVASAVADMPPMNEFLEVARGSMEAAV